jgi:hypothetical protein
VPPAPAFLALALAALALAAALLAPADEARAQIGSARPVTPQDAWNPKPDDLDYVLPLPCDLAMAFRPVFMTEKGYLGETVGYFGTELQSSNDQTESFSRRHRVYVGSPLSISELPEAYRPKAVAAVQAETRLDPEVRQLILVQKYETTVAQYDAVMREGCPFDPRTAALPVTNVTWYDAQGFTERLMAWVLANRPETLPAMADDPRIVGIVRLPTEDEWEYAARGGHRTGKDAMSSMDAFPMDPGDDLGSYGLYYDGSAPPPTAPARIGRKKPNPAGLYDTVGNASEMTMDAYKLTIGSRLHGSAGGFVRKGGSFRTQYVKSVPGAREELPFFYRAGPVRTDDMGFRLVISTMNGGSIARINELSAELQTAATTDTTLVTNDPMKILDELIQSAENDRDKQLLNELRGSLLSYNTAVNEQRKEAARSHLMGILYTMMSLRETNSRMMRAHAQRQTEINFIKRIDDALKDRTIPENEKKKLRAQKEQRVKSRDEFQKMIEDGEDSYARLREHYETLLLESKSFPRDLMLQELAALSRSITGEDYFHRELQKCDKAVQMHVKSVLQGGSPSKIPRSELEVASVPVKPPRPTT